MYSLYESDFHRPNIWISLSSRPASFADVAAPLLKECPEKLPFKSSSPSNAFSLVVKKSLVKAPSGIANKGVFDAVGKFANRYLRDFTAHASSSAWLTMSLHFGLKFLHLRQ